MIETRRSFLALAGLTPLTILGANATRAADLAACSDPAKLPLSQKSRRRANEYVEQSADPAKHCSVCSFFTAAAPGCGSCTILAGPVDAGGVCTSFARKTTG